MQDIIERYLDTFNERDAERRRALLDALYTADATYVDPHVDLAGTDQVNDFISETQDRFAGFTFTLGSPVDAHHNLARFRWHAGPADEPDRYIGFDVIVTDGERIRHVHGFMDAAPAT